MYLFVIEEYRDEESEWECWKEEEGIRMEEGGDESVGIYMTRNKTEKLRSSDLPTGRR